MGESPRPRGVGSAPPSSVVAAVTAATWNWASADIGQSPWTAVSLVLSRTIATMRTLRLLGIAGSQVLGETSDEVGYEQAPCQSDEQLESRLIVTHKRNAT